MRMGMAILVAGAVLTGGARAEEPTKTVPKVVVKAPDGKQVYDLNKLAAEGPVLVRLTCACSGCDQELPYFQKLQAAYETKGFRTLAVFKEEPDTAKDYVDKHDVRFLWATDPKGELWKTFDTKAMPTNILIDKGGRLVIVVRGCTKDGKNAQALSAEVAKLLKTDVAAIADRPSGQK
ncbi:MAG TPA: TlpA disulfide reductase family protein [Gemmataceae bacterium]|nr:TlpA disulfide reductase family protein [Gemmataceae bacterium]